ALVYLHVVADLGGLSDDHARAVVDTEIFPNTGSRVDVNPRAGMRIFGQHTGDDGNAQLQQRMGDPIQRDGQKTGIGTDHLKLVGGRGISVENGFGIRPQDPIYAWQALKEGRSDRRVVDLLAGLGVFQNAQQVGCRHLEPRVDLVNAVAWRRPAFGKKQVEQGHGPSRNLVVRRHGAYEPLPLTQVGIKFRPHRFGRLALIIVCHVYFTSLSYKLASVCAASAVNPGCTGEGWMMVLRLAVSQRKRSAGTNAAMAPPEGSPCAISRKADACRCSSSRSASGKSEAQRAQSDSMRASTNRCARQYSTTPTLMYSPRSTRGTNRTTAYSNTSMLGILYGIYKH